MMKKLMILTYGLSRTGKSSFINTIARSQVTQVGSSDNESTTMSVNCFEVNLASLPTNPASLRIFDVPGNDDSKMRMSNEDIKQKIEETVLSISDTDRLSAILVFEALPNQPSRLRQTLMDLEVMLGPECKRSTIVVLTKADNFVYPQDLAGAKGKAEEICREHHIPFIYLQNNHKDFKLNDAQYNEQFDLLMDKIKSRAPYLLEKVQHYQNRINELARELELTLPKNKKNIQIDYETQELKSEIVQVTKTRPKYEIGEKRRGGIPGVLGFKKTFVTCSCESYIENETRYHPETVQKSMNQEMELEYDFSYYLDLAKKQVLEEIRNQYRRN